jgi:uncharacterized membrane protein
MGTYYYVAVLFWLHLLSISMWVGGHLVRTLLVWPALRLVEPAVAQHVKDAYLARLTPFTAVAFPTIIVTGILQIQARFGFAYLLSINALTLKLLVFVLMVLTSGYEIHTRDLMVPLRKAQDAISATRLKRLQRRETVASWVQVALIVVIFLLVGLLTS